MSDHTDTTLTDTERERFHTTHSTTINPSTRGCPLCVHDLPVVESVVAARVAAARADERANWVSKIDALATRWRFYGRAIAPEDDWGESVADTIAGDIYVALASHLRALIEGADQ